MKKAGIVLLCLQALALLGSIVNGSFVDMFSFSPYGLGQLTAFLSLGIIGVILLLAANKNEKEQE